MINPSKGEPMSRLTKFLSLSVLILFILACSTVTQPIKDVQEIAGTAKSFATSMPVETLKALASQIPASTLQALPSALPDLQGYLNPQGTPVSEWNGIPIMSQATAGQEFTDTHTYSFKANATVKEVEDFYNAKLPDLGWSSFFSMPGSESGAVLVFNKDSSVLTITITASEGSVVAILTMA
jgi:hypothetical protein